MYRREFLKVGVLSVSAIYLFPATLRQLAARDAHGQGLSDEDEADLRFRGRSYEEITDNGVKMPEDFIPSLRGKQIHFVAAKGKGHLLLLPGDGSLEKSLKSDLKKLPSTIPEDQYLYLGQRRIRESGLPPISQKVRAFSSIPCGDVVIVGLLQHIEIWNKKAWDVEYEKARKLFPSFPFDLEVL